jgi:hypothetical protein
VFLHPVGVLMVGTDLGAVTVRQDCDEARPAIVGQASDEASGSVGQAGAGDPDDRSKPRAAADRAAGQ